MSIIDEIIKKAGGPAKLAEKLGITRPAVLHWQSRGYETPPLKHAHKIEIITGIPKEKIWKSYFSDQEGK